VLELPVLSPDQQRRGAAFLLGLTSPLEKGYLRRVQVTAKLCVNGFPVGEMTLARLAARGEGPPFYRFGNVALYRWDEVIAWARGRLKAQNHLRRRQNSSPGRRQIKEVSELKHEKGLEYPDSDDRGARA
jgi:hypothetical protein